MSTELCVHSVVHEYTIATQLTVQMHLFAIYFTVTFKYTNLALYVCVPYTTLWRLLLLHTEANILFHFSQNFKRKETKLFNKFLSEFRWERGGQKRRKKKPKNAFMETQSQVRKLKKCCVAVNILRQWLQHFFFFILPGCFLGTFSLVFYFKLLPLGLV